MLSTHTLIGVVCRGSLQRPLELAHCHRCGRQNQNSPSFLSLCPYGAIICGIGVGSKLWICVFHVFPYNIYSYLAYLGW